MCHLRFYDPTAPGIACVFGDVDQALARVSWLEWTDWIDQDCDLELCMCERKWGKLSDIEDLLRCIVQIWHDTMRVL